LGQRASQTGLLTRDAARWEGRAGRQVALPAAPFEVSVPAGGDIFAIQTSLPAVVILVG